MSHRGQIILQQTVIILDTVVELLILAEILNQEFQISVKHSEMNPSSVRIPLVDFIESLRDFLGSRNAHCLCHFYLSGLRLLPIFELVFHEPIV
jgi:hypothetical protein